jgi:REP element-mobilizing transposase RayT
LSLNDAGKILEKQWLDLAQRYTHIRLHEYVVMPNHFHGIIQIHENNNENIGTIVGTFKSLTTRDYIQGVHTKNWLPFEKKLWQRNYYEHIIRNEESYLTLSKYIKENPKRWKEDKFFT